MNETTLLSQVVEAEDDYEINEIFQRNNWTDGLPIIPPTESRVRRFLSAMGVDSQEVIGVEPVRRRRITAEKVAIAAIMAGCLEEHMSVVRAVIQAMCEPEFGLHGCTASTGGAAPMVIVNGPIRAKISMNSTNNVLANGGRANAAIGRTTRLVILNVLGGVPGQLDRSTMGHPGKFTFCLAEDEEDSKWTPLAQQRGIPAGTSAVTVLAVQSPHQIMNEWTSDPKEILDTFAAAIKSNMLDYSIWAGNYAMVVAKQHRDIFINAGWEKRDIQEYMFERCQVFRKQWRDVGKGAIAGRKDEEKAYSALRTPDDLLVVAAGGNAGAFGVIAPPWYGKKSLAVTMPVSD